MKKFLLLILALCLTLPVCAEISNEKQKKDESILRGIINSDSGRLSKHQTSIKEDYSDEKNSIFTQLNSLEKKYKKKNDEKSQLNLSYIAKAKELYLYLAEYPSELTMVSDFVYTFNSKIITIPDTDYDSLDEDLIMIISVINVYK